MAYVTTSSPVFYSGGSSGASSVVGYEAKRTRVARYSFTTSAEGATRLDVWISKVYRGDSDCKATTASALITTNGSSVPSIGTASTATLTWGSSNNVMSGVISYTFLPSTTYYLWVYPSSTTYGWWSWPTAAQSITTSGSTAAVTPKVSPSTLVIGEDAFTITAKPPASGYTCKVTSTIGNTTVATDSYTYSSYTHILAGNFDGLFKAFRAETSGSSATIKFTCQTYNSSGGLVGTKSTTATVTMVGIDETYYEMYFKPTVTFTSSSITDNATIKSWEESGYYIANYSKLRLTPSYTHYNGANGEDTQAAIKSYTLSAGANGSWSGSTLSSYYDVQLTATGSFTPQFSITDTRGRSTSLSTSSYTVYAYNAPAFRIAGSGRCTSSSSGLVSGSATYTPVANGTKAYIKIDSASFSSIGEKNACAATILCNGTTVGEFDISASTKQYEYIIDIDGGLQLDEEYQIEVKLVDSFNTISTSTKIQKRTVGLHLMKGGLGAAVGKYSEVEGLFDIGFKTRFYSGVEPKDIGTVTTVDDVLTPNLYSGSCTTFNGSFMLDVTPLPSYNGNARAKQVVSFYNPSGDLIIWQRAQVRGGSWTSWSAMDVNAYTNSQIDAKFPKILYGVVEYSYTTSGNGSSIVVNFDTATNYNSVGAFSGKPVVMCSQPFDSANVIVKQDEVYASYFTMRMAQMSAAGSRNVMWVAVGV